MGAIGLNPIRLDAIGLDPIRFNAIRLGVPGASSATDRPYISPDVLSALAGVWIADGKSNTDPDRNIIKNKLPGRGGDFEILNAAYKLNSGFGKYAEDFSTMKDYGTKGIVRTSSKIYLDESFDYNKGFWLGYTNSPSPAYKVRVSGIPKDGVLNYTGGSWINLINGINELPARTNTEEIHGFVAQTPNVDWSKLVIEQIPENEGSFVTDGVNDMIVSQNPVSEMLDGSKELTVVSMIHQISPVPYSYGFTNYIREGSIWSRTNVKTSGKTGIYGYKISKGNTEVGASNLINNILGDKADYEAMGYNITNYSDINYSVAGYIKDGSPTEVSSVAWYWTFIAKRALTTDEINQVIAYYNLDKYVKPDIYYDVKKQGLTNDNHAEFNDKLIDYSGNGRDLQLFNIGWKGESGVGRYTEEFKNDYWLVHKDQTGIIKDGNSIKVVGKLSNYYIVYHTRTKAINSFKLRIKGIKTEIIYSYISSDKEQSISFKEDGIYDIPASEAVDSTFTLGFYFKSNDINLDWIGLTIEIIPSNKGALCLDGINDFGKVINMPIYKDYTFIVDREILSIDNIGIIASKSESAEDATKHGAFIFEYLTAPNIINTWSYYKNNTNIANTDFIRGISYQSKYNYNGKDLIIGTSKDSDKLYLGTIRDNSDKYGNIAIYFLMSFPYSMNKFLIERQLKKYKAGTLYKDMVEFRPVIKSSVELVNKPTFTIRGTYTLLNAGDYVPKESRLLVTVTMNNLGDELTKFSINGREITISSSAYNPATGKYEFPFVMDDKSPQKINITIDEYIRFEDIVQPYPVKFRFTDVDSGQVYDWGSKIKVGSTIKILSNVDIGNYLSDIYTITGYKYNGNIYSYNELTELTFLITNQPLEFTSRKTYKLGGSEPKVILYPERLKLSNDTYKRLGYIPDLTGNGNHGVFNNLAFTEESGVNEDGSVHLDGVDDYISIPTLSKGGKQVLMKVNWSTLNGFIYDQRPASGDKTFGIYTQGDVIAYSQHNNGNTYIDGIINNNIIGSNLSKITHNIVATCDVDNSITPSIGKRSYSNSYFAQMALYAFMLFDEISTDEGIKDLNDIVGIVSKVELPPYYWDTYGKTNTDADRDEIVNLASDEVSIQYPTDFTDTSVWEDMGAVTSSTILTLTTWAMGGDTGIGNTIKAKVATPAMKVKFITDGNGYLDYMYSGYNTLELPRDAGEYEVELPASTIVDGWGARFSGSGNGSFTIELLGNEVRLGTLKVINSAYDEDSGYKNNGIALDGVDDSLVNTDIPAFTDFTVIAKRIFLGDQPNNVAFLFKGDKVYAQGVGNALLMEYRYDNGTYANYIFSNANSITLNEGDISYVTPTDYNGQQMNYVVNTDNKGLVIGRSNAVYWKGVFYKLMLYPKTIDILSINMLKNLFERDEIIDLNNPIFKK